MAAALWIVGGLNLAITGAALVVWIGWRMQRDRNPAPAARWLRRASEADGRDG